MSQKVSIVLELRDEEQSHHLEQYLRNNMFPNGVISYTNLPNTDRLKETDKTFQKLLKAKKQHDKTIYEYIDKHN